MARRPHLPPVPAPGKFVLHSSDQVSTKTYTAPPPTARPSPGAARSPHLLLALTTTARPLAGYHAPALSAPTMQLALGHLSQSPHPPQVAGSTQHAPAGCLPFPHWRPGPPAHTRGWSPSSAVVAPRPLAPPGAASSYP